jgi:hypothetical protein
MMKSLCMQVAGFLRTQQDNLDKAQVGELLGHHEDFAIAVMHAWVDIESSMAGQAIDQSLRRCATGRRRESVCGPNPRLWGFGYEKEAEGVVGCQACCLGVR